VSNDYQVPFRFTGKLERLSLKIDRPRLSAADIQKLKEATRNNRAAE
jgi:arylsulfatase